MKQLNFKVLAAVAVLALAIPGGDALATRVFDFTVSGTVTRVTSNQIVINGKTYYVPVQGPALRDLEQVHPGQVVDVILSGPPGAAGTQVVAIHVRTTH